MTVKQLKEELEKFDENLPVNVDNRYNPGFSMYGPSFDDDNLILDVQDDRYGINTLFL